MIRRFSKLVRYLSKGNPYSRQPEEAFHQPQPNQQALHSNLELNEERLRDLYTNCSDVIFRSFVIRGRGKAFIVYIDGLSDTDGIEKYVIAPLMREPLSDLSMAQLIERTVSVADAKPCSTIEECIQRLSAGFPILFCDGDAQAYALGLSKWDKRSVEEPSAELGIRGPREGFTETIRTNTSQIRRIIKSPLLKMEAMQIGEYTQTNVILSYIEGLTDEAVVGEARNRLRRIRIDGILESGYIEELIEDHPFTPFPTLLSTERPDVTCANLLEGRIAILVDPSGDVSLRPVKAHVRMTPKIENGVWIMKIRAKTEGDIIQNGTTRNPMNPQFVQSMERSFAQDVKERIQYALYEVQRQWKTDIVDFASKFHQKYPKEWEKNKARWDEIFPQVKTEIAVEASIQRPGNITVPGGLPIDEVNQR